MTEDSAVKVCVRVRPLVEREENAAENAQLYWKADNNSVHQIDGASVKSFSFDRVFTAHETTNQLYQTIAKPLVVSTVQGYNGTIFAYGQTSSGKTFSMMGCDKNPGVIPLAVEDIFQTIQTCSSKEFLLRVSYMEIYNETVSDLLVDSWKRKPLEVREALNKNIYVADLSEELVTSTAQALHWIRFGEKNRHYGKTKMNERSSRSHTIFRMILESREKSDSENSDGAIIVSHLNLVDLAGSERASQTGAEGARFKEGCNINKSLFTLGQVIKKLTDESHKGYTSYRDSKLTRILQNSLGGNAKTVIICTITPAAFDETLSTLQFASTAKKMKNDPHVTEVSDDGALLKRYRNEIVDLKRRLQEVSSVTQSTATEKELLSQLQEKDQLQREQEDRIRNLTNLLVSSNPNPAPVRQAPKRRMTWGGKMLRLAATSSASSEAVLSEMAKRRRVNVSCIEPLDQEFYPPWDAFEELPEDMDATQTSITTRSFGDSPKESASGEQLRDLSEKMAALEQQLEIESCEKSAAESKAKALADRVTELEQQLEEALTEAQQREAKLEEAQTEAQQREAELDEAQTEAQQREAVLDVELRTQTEQRLQLDEELRTQTEQRLLLDEELRTQTEQRLLLDEELRTQTEQRLQLDEELRTQTEQRLLLDEELRTQTEQRLQLDVEMTTLQSRVSEDENQMRRQFSEAIQLCESLSSEKDLLLVERDYLKEELGLSLEQIQTLEKEKSSLCKKLEEKQETDEFEMLEAQIRKDDELEQREEISRLKLVIDSSEQKCLELQTEMEMLSLQLKKKCDFIEELQAMNGKDLVQEVTLLQRSLDDAEKISMDTKKDWACLRSQNMDLKEKNGMLTLNAESHEHELAGLRSQLEREKSKFKKMQFDLQKELNIAFEENVKLGSLLDGKVPKNLIDNVDLERTVTKLNKDLTACLENNTELHVQLEELQQLPDKMAELSKQLEESECVRKSLTEELQEIHTLKRELEEKVSENNTELHLQLEELQQLPDKMAELTKQLEESECVRKSLTEELQEIHTLKRELEEKVSENNTELHLQLEELQQLPDKMAKLTKQLEESECVRKSLTEELQEIHTLKRELEEKVSENNTELHLQLEELQQLPDKMAKLTKQLEESECVRKSLTEELQEIHTLKRELEEKVSNCEETRKTDEDIQKELEEQLEQAAAELQNAQATNEAAMLEWESRLQSLCEERDALQQRMEQVPEAESLVLSLQEQLEEEKQKLSREEALHQQRVSEMNQQMQTVSQELVSLQQERDHSFSSLAALTEERDQLKADLQENIEMMIELQDELRITQEKIRSQKECIQKLQAQTAEESAPDQPEKHEAQIRTLKVELQHLQEHKKSSSDELQTLESRVRGLSEDKDQLQQTLAALTQQKQQLQQVLDSSTDSLQTQITELEQTLHMVSEQKKSLEEQLQNHLETSSQKEELLSSVQEKLKEQEEINTRLCEEHSVLKQQVQSLEANCSSDELQTLESRVRGLSEDKDQLQQTLAALTQQKQQLQQVLDSSTDSLQTQITELEQTLHMVSEQKKSLEEQLQNHLETITELEQTLNMVSEQKKSLEEQLQNNLETELLSSVQEKLKEQEEINTRLCEEHSVLKQQVQSLEANCSSDELQTLESRVRGLSEDKDQLQQTLAALTQQKQQLQQVLDSSTDSLQTQITELEQTLHMVSEQKKSLEEQLQNHLETSSQKEELLSSVQEKLKEQEEINTRLCEEHSVLKQQSEALTEEVQLLRRKEETVPALQQELSDANRTISKLREQPPSEENPEHQLSLLLHDSNTHFQKSLQDLQFMVERCMVPMKRKTVVFTAPAGFSSLPKNTVDSFKAVNFVTVRSVNAVITIEEQLVKYAQRFLQLFEELMKTDLAVFEERRLQDVLLSIRQAPSLCITDMDFMDLWRRRLQQVVHKREQYLTKIDSTMKNIKGFYGDLLNAELEGKDRFETQLSEMCRKEPVDLSALDVFFGTEQQQRNDAIQERDAIFKDFSKDQDASLKQLSEQVAQEKALLEDERSKRFTLQHGLESAPLKSEASLLNDNQRLLHQLHTTQDLLKILSTEKEELQKAQVKAEHLVASHKEATQLLQTELQDTCAKLQEKEEEVEELQTSLQQSQSEWNSSAKAVEVETLNLKVSKLETESQNYRHEIQKLTSLLEAKETTLRRLKETLRSKQEEESMLEGEALHARLVRPKGLVQSSVVLEKSRLDEEAKHLKLRITELESLVSSLQAEVGKWKQRALKMKSVTEAKPKQDQETSSQKRLQFDSPRKLLGSPRKVLESPAQINSPKSRIFDGGSHSEFLLKKCPKQFFDNSSLGAAPGAEGRAEKEDWLQWPLSPKEDMCKKQ